MSTSHFGSPIRFQFLKNRFTGAAWLVTLFALLSTLSRVALTIYCWRDINPWNRDLLTTFVFGLLYDFTSGLAFVLPLILLMTVIPEKIIKTEWFLWIHRMIFTVFLSLFLFIIVSEWIFWLEFGARFNFIAVDYLMYTHEVVRNIQESYPIPWIFGGILTIAILITTFLMRSVIWKNWENTETTYHPRFQTLALAVVTTIILFSILNNRQTDMIQNQYEQEIAKNSVFSLGAAWFDQGIDYRRFYPLMDRTRAFEVLRNLLQCKNSRYLSNNPEEITRWVSSPLPEQHLNVIQITVESLSASFMGCFGNPKGLTPYLDQLSRESLFFARLQATGSRTIRGMEALTLSVPPTPGQSIIRRKNNENLFSLGSLFQAKGYDTVFLYGGYGYFDNMNQFFGSNGYRIMDRGAMPDEAVTFANAWGACDGDVYQWSLREADTAFAKGKPFHHFVMTTSNHRPYTFPAGKIDLPQGKRESAVKYTDFAIQEFLNAAQQKPWFSNTIFVIVADHCAGSSGKTDLPLAEYHIPMMIYCPSKIAPKTVTDLCSQIDYAPTLLGIMGWNYRSRFFGKDVLQWTENEPRALLGTYQKLGYERGGLLSVLKPIRAHVLYQIEPKTLDLTPIPEQQKMREESIAYYQTAHDLFESRANQAIPATEVFVKPSL